VVSSAGLESHCRIILEKFISRELIRIGGASISAGYDAGIDTFDALDMVERELTLLSSGHLTKGYTSLDGELVKRLQRITELRKLARHVTGVHTGYSDLDRLTHGWQPTDLIILAARPAVGKTAFVLNLAKNAASHPDGKVSVGLFSLEMSTGQLTDRLLSIESGVHLDRITNGQLSEDEMHALHAAAQRLSSMEIKIDDTASLNVYQLRGRARTMKRKHNIGLIIIDYLQLMSGMDDKNAKNREQEISAISRKLKILAKEMKVPIIALSQLSRDVEKRKGVKMPVLSDLRDSGAIEQDADMVMFLYRPEYYEENINAEGESTQGETHLRIAKHRNGSLETVKFHAKLFCQRFDTWEGPAAAAPQGTGNWKPVQTQELFDNGLKF
jgi:replicative DNA helicase